MRYVQKVKGNVKGGCSVTLGPRTLIVGPNGAGKSRVVNTLELALSAEASDIVGRAKVRRGPDLIALAPEDAGLEAHVTLDSGEQASLIIERNGPGKTREPVHAPPSGIEIIYPIRDVVEALRGNTQTARTFVLRNAGLDLSDKAILERLPADLHEVYGVFCAAHAEKVDPIERLIAIRDDAKKSATAAKAGVKKSEEIINTLGATLPAHSPGEDDIAAAQTAVRQANAALAQAQIIPVAIDISGLYQDAAQAIENHQTLTQNLEKAREWLAANPADASGPLLMAVSSLLTFHTQNTSLSFCSVCGGGVQHDALTTRLHQINQVASSLADKEKVRAQVQHLESTQSRQVVSAQSEAERLIRRYKQAQETSANALTLEQRQAQITEAQAALSQAEQTYRGLVEAASAWKKVKEARDRVVAAKREAREAAELSEACGAVVDELILMGRLAFCARVQKYLPKTDKFDLVLEDGKREVCIFGFRRGDMIHSALSGAEWARLTIALGAACMESANLGDNALVVLTPEERAFDRRTLASVMRALQNAPGQVIITSPIAPKDPIEGWTVVTVKREGAADTAASED